jgi:hypothetical protein
MLALPPLVINRCIELAVLISLLLLPA